LSREGFGECTERSAVWVQRHFFRFRHFDVISNSLPLLQAHCPFLRALVYSENLCRACSVK
jgi:hypothetical protein